MKKFIGEIKPLGAPPKNDGEFVSLVVTFYATNDNAAEVVLDRMIDTLGFTGGAEIDDVYEVAE